MVFPRGTRLRATKCAKIGYGDQLIHEGDEWRVVTFGVTMRRKDEYTLENGSGRNCWVGLFAIHKFFEVIDEPEEYEDIGVRDVDN